MQIIKVIVGAGSLLVALYFTVAAVASLFLNSIFTVFVFAILATLFFILAWLLILKGKPPMSAATKVAMVISGGLFVTFLLTVLIPDFIAAQYENNQEGCVNYLRQLQAGKEEWALETGATNGAPVTVNDITAYIQLDSRGNIARCPAGGTYIMGRVGEDVRCSIGTSDWPYRHVLNDTNNFDWWTNFKEAYATLLGFHHPRKP